MADHDVAAAGELATVFARMSGLLLSEETVHSALELISSLAVETIPAAAGCGVTLLDTYGKPTTAAASDPLVTAADIAQYKLDDGPCLVAWRRRIPVRVDDTATDERWPTWGRAAADLGLRSVLSVPLVAADAGLGAVKLYAREPAAFDARSEHLLTLFGAQAAILLANVQSYRAAERISDKLREALQAREMIAQAKGILMGRHGTGEHSALLMLMAAAKRDGRPLLEAARAVVAGTTRRVR
jgi:GAF domain-containing protein